MNSLLEIGLNNALVASLLALPVAGLAAVCRRPALAHSLWLLVLVKLVTPPLVLIPLPWSVPGGPLAAATSKARAKRSVGEARRSSRSP